MHNETGETKRKNMVSITFKNVLILKENIDYRIKKMIINCLKNNISMNKEFD